MRNSTNVLSVLTFLCALASLVLLCFVLVDDGWRLDRFRKALIDVNERYAQAYAETGERYYATSDDIRERVSKIVRFSHEMERGTREALEALDGAAMATKLTAWQVLSAPSPGDLGQSEAIRYLIRQEEELSWLNLSCPRPEGDTCPAPVVLRDVVFDGGYLSNVSAAHVELRGVSFVNGQTVTNSDFSDALLYVDLRGADFDSSSFRGSSVQSWEDAGSGFLRVDFSDAVFRGGRFAESRLYSSRFDRALVEYVDFSGAILNNVSFEGAGLSGSKFAEVKVFEEVDLTDAWAWDDQVPTGIDLDLITLCPFEERHWGSSPVRSNGRPETC